ncbi:unnamed protein product [Callosobruchus maculatus]|uniref:Uncharacterized protein n=1 Tax=Callosobruchus maculatus TaxID=64391 RepID=A0A653D2L8_CALMS|nr:unnamed protein product [Callosobruchus maculatus]VEN62937.1 unnamed protein product [Callosobruchus maculatus]
MLVIPTHSHKSFKKQILINAQNNPQHLPDKQSSCSPSSEIKLVFLKTLSDLLQCLPDLSTTGFLLIGSG